MRALLDVAGLEGEVDAVRLAAVVLAARTPEATGQVEIRTGELARWLGMSKSYTASVVLPGLRRSGVVRTGVVEGEFGEDRAVACEVVPLWEARGVVGHPLALSRKELATLLRLLEAVMAPGWVHRDGRVTPAGLLGARTGRGAATDRLALLLLVLEATETGRVRLCGGSVDTQRGRAAATVARLLGRTAASGERVLERLEDGGLVERPRRETASGLAHRSRLLVPAVAAAHRAVGGPAGSEGRGRTSEPGFSDPDVAARGSGHVKPDVEAQVNGAQGDLEAETAEPDVTAALHTDHSSVADVVIDGAVVGGFSGDGRGGEGRRPERVCVREDQAADCGPDVAGSAPTGTEGGPLRGEKPKESSVDERDGQRAAGAGGRPKAAGGEKAQQLRRVGLPADLRLGVALGPVAGLWERLSGWQQDQVEAAAKAEATRLAGMLMRPETAPRLLADRLSDRLEETGGESLIGSPYGWLIRRGLVQRPACSDRRCDDGIQLDTGGECENCGNVIHLRRARRARIAAQVDRELPGLGGSEHRQVLEDRLREEAAREAEDFAWRREQAAAEQARRDTARAVAKGRAERERQAAAADEAVRQAQPCEDCGQQRAAGLCEACGYRRRTEAAIGEAGLVAATWAADLTDPGDVAAVTDHVRATLETDIEAALKQFLELMEPGELAANPVAAASALAFTALQTVEQALPEYRSSALGQLGRTEEAETEARRAYKTEQNSRWFRANPTGADAVAAATKAADTARERTAQYLLGTRLNQLREQQAARTQQAAPAPWADRLPELAARPLDGDTAGAVIA
ncbi:hypothetical protein [Streptantibioticus ferralitis]|uniref:Uncharacterized protein n=1 Tax=Streptantibioticus ferralitis TaxID=236510 RepID=A0ABT5Z7F7_9ACTN|nr:hypothetical protein [Streptantibioticus ferralitis]MDF2259744.1 hypothetical protein [Streptantibioticus ferralitis]